MSPKITVEFHDNVAIITMRDGENRINHEFLKNFNSALDEVLSNSSASALVTTGEKKFYSNGIDLMALGHLDVDSRSEFMKSLCKLCARLLTFPLPTVAAINGHAFAGGAFLAFSHDYRVMNSDRGWLSVNEVHLPSRIPFFLLDILRYKIPKGVLQTEVITMGKRFTATQALDAGLVQRTTKPDQLIQEAKELLRSSLSLGGFDRDAMGWMKRDLYAEVLLRVERDANPEPISRL